MDFASLRAAASDRSSKEASLLKKLLRRGGRGGRSVAEAEKLYKQVRRFLYRSGEVRGGIISALYPTSQVP